MLPTIAYILAFGVIGDTQSTSTRVMRKAVTQMQTHKLSFAVHLGDIYWQYNKRQWLRRKALMTTLRIPMYWVFGNHEQKRYHFRRVFHSTYKVWKQHGHRFITLDNAFTYIPRWQLTKLQAELKTNMPTWLFMHRAPAYPKSVRVQYTNGKCVRRCWHSTLDPPWYGRRNAELWQTILAHKKQIQAIFHGHHHAYAHYKLAGIPVYISGGGGGRLARCSFYHWLKVVIQKTGYRVRVNRL